MEGCYADQMKHNNGRDTVGIPRKTWAVPRPPLTMTPTFWREIKCARSKKGGPPAIVFQEEGDSDTVKRGKWGASR
jgi:hypothetical protein